MKRYALIFLCPLTLSLSLGAFFLPDNASAQAYLPMFDSIFDASQRCPYDVVVWINSQAAVQGGYKGQPGKKKGGYVCRQEAIDSGYGGLVTHLQPMPKPTR